LRKGCSEENLNLRGRDRKLEKFFIMRTFIISLPNISRTIKSKIKLAGRVAHGRDEKGIQHYNRNPEWKT
jgi:hypothetical protein